MNKHQAVGRCALVAVAFGIACTDSPMSPGVEQETLAKSDEVASIYVWGETWGPHGEIIRPERTNPTNRADTTFFTGRPNPVIVSYVQWQWVPCPECGSAYDGGAVFISAQIDGETKLIGRLEADFSTDGNVFTAEIPVGSTIYYYAQPANNSCHFLYWWVNNQQVFGQELERPASANDGQIKADFQCSE